MAKKEFLFHGKKLEELQAMDIESFIELLPSRQRRSVKRMLAGKDDDRSKLYKKIKDGKRKIRTHCREFIILPNMVDLTVSVHNGRAFQDVLIKDKMIGHTLGEFALTRAFLTHSTPGIGASKSTKFVSVRA